MSDHGSAIERGWRNHQQDRLQPDLRGVSGLIDILSDRGWYPLKVPTENFHAKVLSALARGGARFVVVGGVAVNLQGVPRFTADLDVAIALDATTLRAVSSALTGLGLTPRLPVPATQFEDPVMVQDWIANRHMKAFTFQDAHDPLRQVDLLLAAAVPFDEIVGSAEIFQAFGVQVPVASIEMLIRMKSGTGRAQDVSDVEALTRVREARRGGD